MEALTDSKTWLFALFALLNNIPSSILLQRQLIVSSFGFTRFQTTLLGCFDGVLEIITIWTGVQLAAHLQDARAYVGTAYMTADVLAAILVTSLPWSNKIGLLCATYLTGNPPSQLRPSNCNTNSIHRYWHDRICALTLMAIERDGRTHEEGDHERNYPLRSGSRKLHRPAYVAGRVQATVCSPPTYVQRKKPDEGTETTFHGQSLDYAIFPANYCS